MKTENNKTNIEKEEDKRNESETNDIKSRLRKNPNKTKPLYIDEYSDKKIKRKEGQVVPPNSKEICRTILDLLKKDEKSALFRQPAIRAFSEKEDKDNYKSQIKEPRDLGNITKKLKATKYKAKEFYEDVELCWSNAIAFNANNTEAYKNAIYMKELSEKLFKEYGLIDIINKEKEDNNNINTTNVNENETHNNEINIENKEKNDINCVNTIIENNNVNNVNINTNIEANEVKEIKPNKMVGRKRKRINNLGMSDNFGESIEIKKERKKDESINNKFSIFDITKKFIIKHQIISSPDDIHKMYKKINKRKKKSKKNNILNLLKSDKFGKKSHVHHNSKKHFSYIQKQQIRNNINKKEPINFSDISRKVNFEWIQTMYFNKTSYYYINQNIAKNEEINNNNDQIKLYNIPEFKMNLNKDNKKELEEIANYDKNLNSENVYNLDEIKEMKEKYSLKQSMGYDKNNINNNNSYNPYYNKEDNNMNKRNNSINKKNDKNYNLRNDIAKYFDKLSDNNMIDLLVYIENIRPQSIKELANDTIYLNMELFNDDTFTKVLEFVKSYT